jgi:hypothetical protein
MPEGFGLLRLQSTHDWEMGSRWVAGEAPEQSETKVVFIPKAEAPAVSQQPERLIMSRVECPNTHTDGRDAFTQRWRGPAVAVEAKEE